MSKRPNSEPLGGPEKRAATEAEVHPPGAGSRKRLRFAVICSSNQNRSMEGHKFLAKKGFDVRSYGSGNQVKLPGPAPDKPNVYDFGGCTYEEMHSDLKGRDERLYTENGILNMLERNMGIKARPERFQDEKDKTFDILLTCEGRVFDQVVQDLEERQPETNSAVHVCNLEIKDNHESATIGALNLVKLAEMIEGSEDVEDEIGDVLEAFEADTGEAVLHTVAFY